MANHIRQQNPMAPSMQQQHLRKRQQTSYERFVSQMQRIRSSPKMMMGTILMILLLIVIVVVALHYFRLYSFPFLTAYIPQKPAPSSHLQYFFF